MATLPARHFEQVYLDYVAALDAKSGKSNFIGSIKLQWQNVPIEDLQDSVDGLVQKCADRKLRRWMQVFIMPVVNGLKDYSQAIDQIVAAYPMPAAIVWGGIRAVIEATVRFSGSLETIQSVLGTLTSHMWALGSCETLYSGSGHSAPTVQAIVGRSYVHIIDLWYRITKQLSKSQLKQVGNALFRNEKLEKALVLLKEDADELQRICTIAEAELEAQSRGLIADLSEEYRVERELQIIERAAAAEERRLNELYRRNMEVELKAAREQLKQGFEISEQYQRAATRREVIESINSDNTYNADLLRNMIEGRHPETCSWVFGSTSWLSWVSEKSTKPVFWLHGKHGCGKSYICSAAIEKIKGSPDIQCVAFLFISRGRETSRTQLLRALAYQLAKCVESRSGDISDETASLIRACSTDSACFERLISRLLLEIPRMFIFVDGLDEASNWLDMAAFVAFLRNEAVSSGRLRLWLSSQYSPVIEALVCRPYGDKILELAVEVADTERDIARYLDHAVPESTKNANSLARRFVTFCVNTEVQGSFLWAAQMINDLKEQAENSDDLLRLAGRGLPTSMHDYYRTTIAAYRKRRSSHASLPLWKIILSLLTFVKRPLRLFEIREAIAVIRSSAVSDISESMLILDDTKITSECTALVRYVKPGDGSTNGTLVLSHSAVHTFLREHSESDKRSHCTIPDCQECDLVSADIITLCCLRYLMQPRYAALEQKSRLHFVSKDGSLLREHHFVLYAAKYWYRHCDDSSASTEIRELARRFLLSENFQTCLQIQSVSIIGHFLISFNPLTGRPKSLKQNLPSWTNLIDGETTKFQDQYKAMLREWSHLLQLGLSSQFIGEVDRVFWNSLGPESFLSKGRSRYNSFILGNVPPACSQTSDTPKSCMLLSSSGDGATQTLFYFDTRNLNEIKVQIKPLQTSPPNKWKELTNLAVDLTVPISEEESELLTIESPCSQKFPLIPQTTQAAPSNTIKIGQNGDVLHVGTKVFIRHEDSSSYKYREIQLEKYDGYFEESCRRGTFTALSRRRKLKKMDAEARQKEEERATQLRRKRREMDRQRAIEVDSESSDDDFPGPHHGRSSDDDLLLDGVQSSVGSDDDNEEDNEVGNLSSFSAGDLIGTPGDSPTASDSESSLASEGSSSPSSFDSPIESETDTDDQQSNLISGSDDQETVSDCKSDISTLVSESGEAFSDEDGAGDDKQASSEAEGDQMFRYPVGIEPKKSYGIICDGCNSEQYDTWFRCAFCEPENGFDLCTNCVKEKGFWCYDKRHQLYECYPEGTRNVLSWSNFIIRQELCVFDTANGADKLIFSYKKTKPEMLHESPPIFHPSEPMVAWPVGYESLLLANFSEGMKRVHSHRATSRKARQLSMNLHFSECGQYLHVGTVEAVRMLDKKKRTIQAPKVYGLTVVIQTLRISTSKSSINRPVTIAKKIHNLGIWKKIYFPTIPYTWTWTKSAAYFCINGLTLRVYKIPLAVPGAQFPDNEPITTPLETVFLPHSAQERSVQFFPPSLTAGLSTVIIGPQYGSEPSAAIGVYLKENDLGPWVDVKEKEDANSLRGLKRRATGKFEEFDTDDDCDIIPYDAI